MVGIQSLLFLCICFNVESLAINILVQDEVFALNNISSMLNVFFKLSYDSFSCQRYDRNGGLNCSCTQSGTCHVTELSFTSQDLTGQISPEIGKLSYLESLNLKNNMLHGPIPTELKNLLSLQYLDLSFNQFQGNIPDIFGVMQGLSSIDLSYNFLGGPIPPSLGALPSLEFLYLDHNQLTGRIPDELGKISTLRHLYLGDNHLTGTIPQALGELLALEVIHFPVNNLTGSLPSSFVNLKNLLHFSVRGNSLSGKIPEFVADWTNLKYLSFLGNNFEGVLPSGIFQLEGLITLWVSDLGVGKDSTFPQLSKLGALINLVLRNCSITDRIPEYIGRMGNLTVIDLSFNNLTGEIPNSIGNLTLNYLCLTRNNFSGPIPNWVPNSVTMDFSYNSFSDPKIIQNKSNVNLFNCCTPTSTIVSSMQILNEECPHKKYSSLHINCGGGGAVINGSYYEEDIGNLPFYISPNKTWAYSLSGDFLGSPAGPQNNTKNLTCGITVPDSPLYSTARISPLTLDYYGLCLRNGKYNVTLYFAEIIFTDEDDHSVLGERLFDIVIQGVKVEKDFNIKYESGGPKKIASKTYQANVKNNLLNIHLYWSGKGSMGISSTLYGPLISAVSVISAHKSGKKYSVVEKALIGLVAAYALSAMILVLVARYVWGKPQDSKLVGVDLKDYTYQQILLATDKFSDKKKIGSKGGRVYKADLNDGTTLAVKVVPLNEIKMPRKDDALATFANEVLTYVSLKHENLVKLLGWYAGSGMFLLVYEYMGSGSLHDAIFGRDGPIIGWTDRLNICIDVAKALVYLHERSEPRIIHGDIKTNNILLDPNFRAKVSDLGSARFYTADASVVYTKFRGTSGYVAPEYQDVVTSKADVYSYGILLLEIVSGKENVPDNSHPERACLFDKACLHGTSGLWQLVDNKVLNHYGYSRMKAVELLELAMLCTSQSLLVRPRMSLVLAVLEGRATIPDIKRQQELENAGNGLPV